MSVKQLGKSFNQVKRDYAALKARLPRMVGTEAMKFFKESFDRQGWVDEGFERWAPRQAKAKRNKGRHLLVDTGRLKKSIRVIKAVPGLVVVGTDVPYAQIHNDGGTVNKTVTVRP